MTDARPVWLSREQRDWIARHSHTIARRWDAAPDDPKRVVSNVLDAWLHGDDTSVDAFDECVTNVLLALGMPA